MGVLFFFYDGVDGCRNGQFYAVFSRQVEECLCRADAFGQFFEGLSFDEVLAEAAVIAVQGKEGRFVIAEVAQAVDGHGLSAHGGDKDR